MSSKSLDTKIRRYGNALPNSSSYLVAANSPPPSRHGGSPIPQPAYTRVAAVDRHSAVSSLFSPVTTTGVFVEDEAVNAFVSVPRLAAAGSGEDAALVVTAEAGAWIRVRDSVTGAVRHQRQLRSLSEGTCILWHPATRDVWVGQACGLLSVFQLVGETLMERRDCVMHRAPITGLVLFPSSHNADAREVGRREEGDTTVSSSAGDDKVATVDESGALSLWDPVALVLVDTASIACSSPCNCLAADSCGDGDGKVQGLFVPGRVFRVLDGPNSAASSTRRSNDVIVQLVQYSPATASLECVCEFDASNMLASFHSSTGAELGDNDVAVSVLSLAVIHPTQHLSSHVSPQPQLWVGLSNGAIAIWQVERPHTPLRVLRHHADAVHLIAGYRQGSESVVWSASIDGHVVMWDTTALTCIGELPLSYPLNRVPVRRLGSVGNTSSSSSSTRATRAVDYLKRGTVLDPRVGRVQLLLDRHIHPHHFTVGLLFIEPVVTLRVWTAATDGTVRGWLCQTATTLDRVMRSATTPHSSRARQGSIPKERVGAFLKDKAAKYAIDVQQLQEEIATLKQAKTALEGRNRILNSALRDATKCLEQQQEQLLQKLPLSSQQKEQFQPTPKKLECAQQQEQLPQQPHRQEQPQPKQLQHQQEHQELQQTQKALAQQRHPSSSSSSQLGGIVETVSPTPHGRETGTDTHRSVTTTVTTVNTEASQRDSRAGTHIDSINGTQLDADECVLLQEQNRSAQQSTSLATSNASIHSQLLPDSVPTSSTITLLRERLHSVQNVCERLMEDNCQLRLQLLECRHNELLLSYSSTAAENQQRSQRELQTSTRSSSRATAQLDSQWNDPLAVATLPSRSHRDVVFPVGSGIDFIPLKSTAVRSRDLFEELASEWAAIRAEIELRDAAPGTSRSQSTMGFEDSSRDQDGSSHADVAALLQHCERAQRHCDELKQLYETERFDKECAIDALRDAEAALQQTSSRLADVETGKEQLAQALAAVREENLRKSEQSAAALREVEATVATSNTRWQNQKKNLDNLTRRCVILQEALDAQRASAHKRQGARLDASVQTPMDVAQRESRFVPETHNTAQLAADLDEAQQRLLAEQRRATEAEEKCATLAKQLEKCQSDLIIRERLQAAALAAQDSVKSTRSDAHETAGDGNASESAKADVRRSINDRSAAVALRDRLFEVECERDAFQDEVERLRYEGRKAEDEVALLRHQLEIARELRQSTGSLGLADNHHEPAYSELAPLGSADALNAPLVRSSVSIASNKSMTEESRTASSPCVADSIEVENSNVRLMRHHPLVPGSQYLTKPPLVPYRSVHPTSQLSEYSDVGESMERGFVETVATPPHSSPVSHQSVEEGSEQADLPEDMGPADEIWEAKDKEHEARSNSSTPIGSTPQHARHFNRVARTPRSTSDLEENYYLSHQMRTASSTPTDPSDGLGMPDSSREPNAELSTEMFATRIDSNSSREELPSEGERKPARSAGAILGYSQRYSSISSDEDRSPERDVSASQQSDGMDVLPALQTKPLTEVRTPSNSLNNDAPHEDTNGEAAEVPQLPSHSQVIDTSPYSLSGSISAGSATRQYEQENHLLSSLVLELQEELKETRLQELEARQSLAQNREVPHLLPSATASNTSCTSARSSRTSSETHHPPLR